MLLMALDHVLVYVPGDVSDLLRLTVTRFAMPLFFVLSGHLVKRFRWRRMVLVAALGVALYPVYWVDQPNVLTLYVIGAAYIVYFQRRTAAMVLMIAVALTWFANGFTMRPDGTLMYEPLALFALMCAGVLLPRNSFDWCNRIRPHWLRVIGSFPLSFYVIHILIIFVVGETLS